MARRFSVFWALWNGPCGEGSGGALARMACSSSARLCMAGCTRTVVGAYGTGVGWCAPAIVADGVRGFPAALMRSCRRAGPVREVAGLMEDCRLVRETGPGGWGKTGLAWKRLRGGRRTGRRTGCGWRQRKTRRGWPAAGAGREGRGRARGMPGRPRGAGGPSGLGVTCGGVAA